MICVGDLVKVRIQPESFWCKVDDLTKDGDVLFLTIDNNLVSKDKHGLSLGDGLIWPVSEIVEHYKCEA